MKKSVKKKSRKKKQFSLKEQYKLSWEFLKDSRNYILFALLFFVLFALIGFIFPYIVPAEVLAEVMAAIQELIKELLAETEGLEFLGMFRFIFINNLTVGIVAILLGFGLGIIPAILLMSNGFVIGFISNLAFSVEGASSLLRLVPHGIFEIPAIIISLAIGIRNGTFIFHKNRMEKFREYLKNSFRIIVFVVLPLLIVAALIEAWLIVGFG